MMVHMFIAFIGLPACRTRMQPYDVGGPDGAREDSAAWHMLWQTWHEAHHRDACIL